MTRRHYGIRVPKPRPTYTGPARAGAWSGSAFISVIVVILIVLGVILYGLSKTITDTAKHHHVSAPHDWPRKPRTHRHPGVRRLSTKAGCRSGSR